MSDIALSVYTTVKLRLPSYKGGRRGTIKERSGMDLTEAEAIKKRWQEYTEGTIQKRSLRPR